MAAVIQTFITILVACARARISVVCVVGAILPFFRALTILQNGQKIQHGPVRKGTIGANIKVLFALLLYE
jgi:hypothetical protein